MADHGALNPAGLLGTLSACGVDFVVIGALAVGAHSEVRATGDVDVMVPVGDEANKRALQNALEQLGAVLLSSERGGVDLTRATLIRRSCSARDTASSTSCTGPTEATATQRSSNAALRPKSTANAFMSPARTTWSA